MDAIQSDDPPKPGLRERKKAKMRALIQEHALRLFRENGYDETSVEDIAEAAEVSPSTVFRYFPTKPDLVIYDDLDERMIEAFRAQPPEFNAIQTLRASFRSEYWRMIAEQLDVQREREQLLRSVPELQAAMLGEFARTLREIAGLLGERSGRAPDDDEVLALAGAVIGVTIAAWFAQDDGDWSQFVTRVETGLERLQTGFTL